MPPTTPQQTIIDIQGMNCQHCVSKVETALRQIAGVQNVHVDLTAKQACITFDPAAVSVARLMQTVTASGFTPTAFHRA